jgi:hypothetical protein
MTILNLVPAVLVRVRTVAATPMRGERALQSIIFVVLFGALALGGTAPVSAQSTPYNSLTLDWTAPGDDGDVGQVSSYQLRYSTSAVGPDTTSWWNGIPSSQRLTLVPPLAPAGATDSYTVSGLTQGTTYYFVLRALDEVPNISGYSNVAVGTTQSCSAPTSAPDPFSTVADTGQVLVSWSQTIDPLAVSLHLYRAQGLTAPLTLYRTLSPSATPFLDAPLPPGTTYRYRAAWMGSTCEGPSTSIATATTPGTPGPPPPTGAAGSSIHVYPNPSSGPIRMVIEVAASTSQAVRVRLFDLNGHWIATLADGTYPPGTSELQWGRVGRDGRQVAPGYYELLGTVGSARVRESLVLLP